MTEAHPAAAAAAAAAARARARSVPQSLGRSLRRTPSNFQPLSKRRAHHICKPDKTYPIVARRVLARFEASLSRLMMVSIFEPEEPAAPPIAPAEPGGTAARGSRCGARGAGAKTARDPIGV